MKKIIVEVEENIGCLSEEIIGAKGTKYMVESLEEFKGFFNNLIEKDIEEVFFISNYSHSECRDCYLTGFKIHDIKNEEKLKREKQLEILELNIEIMKLRLKKETLELDMMRMGI